MADANSRQQICNLNVKVVSRQLAIIIPLCLTIFVIYRFNFSFRATILPNQQSRDRGHTYTWVIDPRQWLRTQQLTVVSSIPCRWSALNGIQIPMCYYDRADDVFVSGAVHSGGIFEQDIVDRVMKLMQKYYPDGSMQLVDIGANIGSFALPVSRTSPVIAVEPNWETVVRLAMSVVLGDLDANLTLAYTAVSNQRTVLNMAYDPANRGHTVISENASCTDGAVEPGLRCLQRPVKTILLDDLLPLMKRQIAIIKIDVEGHEINVFTEETANAFMQAIDVPVILMEWVILKTKSNNDQRIDQAIERMLAFFQRRGYAVFDRNNGKLLSHWKQWPNDIVFKKKYFVNATF